MIGPDLEQCDCYRRGGNIRHGMESKVVENHFYHDPIHNNSVTLIIAVGHVSPCHGRIGTDRVLANRRTSSSMSGNDGVVVVNNKDDRAKAQIESDRSFANFDKDRDIVWTAPTWHDLIRTVVSQLNPKPPEYTLFNAGKWQNKFNDSHVRMDLLQALNDTGMLQGAHWQTTPYGKGSVTKDVTDATDRRMCELLSSNGIRSNNCFNVSWTRFLPDDAYWDEVHFYEPTYRMMNEAMLDRWGLLPTDHVWEESKIVPTFPETDDGTNSTTTDQ